MPRKWPSLEHREVKEILRNIGFTYAHSSGGHDFYKGIHKGKSCTVTVDGHVAPFNTSLIKFMANQANCTREEFYGACERTAKKIQ